MSELHSCRSFLARCDRLSTFFEADRLLFPRCRSWRHFAVLQNTDLSRVPVYCFLGGAMDVGVYRIG